MPKPKFAPSRVISRRRKLLLASSTLAGAAAIPASADVIYTSVNFGSGATISYGPSVGIFFSPDQQRISSAYFSGAEFLLTFHYSSLVPYSYPNPHYPVYGATAVSNHYAAKLDAGTEIGYSLHFVSGPKPLYYTNAGPWSPGTRDFLGLGFFIGSNTQPNFAWADVSYNADNSLTLYGFAYENTPAANITAGAIPEPSDTALFGALLAGSIAAFRARQRRKSPKTA